MWPHGTCEGSGNCMDCPFGALDRQLLLTPRARGPTSTPFLDGVPDGVPPHSFLLSPPSTSRKRKKQLLFTPHLSSKLLNFIPRTNKSIFIAAGGAGSGLLFYLFIFQSPVKSAPIGWAAPRPAHFSPCIWAGVAGGLAGSCLTCCPLPPSGGPQGGWGKLPASLLFVCHFIVF